MNDYSTYRLAELIDRISKIGVRPLDILITGVTGSGKSTTLNTIFQKTVAKTGVGVAPETMQLNAYTLSDELRIWDTPGLGDGIQEDKSHSEKIISLLNKTYQRNYIKYGFIDLAIVIIEGCNRDMGTTYTLLNEVIIPNIQKERIIVAINQADMAMKGRHWDYQNNMPDSILKEFLEQQARSVQRRVKETTGIAIEKPVYYSAQYKYNIDGFLDAIIDRIPVTKREMR